MDHDGGSPTWIVRLDRDGPEIPGVRLAVKDCIDVAGAPTTVGCPVIAERARPAGDWEQARRAGYYSTSTRGQTVADQGFIHGSTADQVAPAANMIYQGEPDLVVLVIDTDRVGPEIRWEQVPGWDAPFPHIYGPLNADAVVGTWPLVPGPDGQFSFDATGT